MILKKKTLEILRDIINEKSEYRSGPKIVAFFNELGFRDSYGQGFPSRWAFTDEKLNSINGTPELDKCIKKVFDPEHFVGKVTFLDGMIKDFNAYLAFDGWQVVRNDATIDFATFDGKKIVQDEDTEINNEEDLLKKEFEEIKISELNLDSQITTIIESRMTEIKACLGSDAPLSVVFLCGSVLEGILLGIALQNPAEFNRAKSAPVDPRSAKVKQFPDWTLSSFIDVAHELEYIRIDIKKFGHAMRDFRNYIHPFQQVAERFAPDIQTAKITWQVLKAAILQIKKRRKA